MRILGINTEIMFSLEASLSFHITVFSCIIAKTVPQNKKKIKKK